MNAAERYAELRARYPSVAESYWQQRARAEDAEHALRELRGGLFELCGYHGHDGNGDGAVPVEKLKSLLAGSAS
ncbi:MAG: hypothetical protein ACRDQB_00095 [Thermocrispum sp.]